MQNIQSTISNFQKKNKNKKKLNTVKRFRTAICVVLFFMLAIVLTPTNNQRTYATSQSDVDNLNSQITDLTTRLNAKKAEAKTFADEVVIYDDQIQTIQLQIQATQAQIDVSNSKITNINEQIAENEAQLLSQKEYLKENLRVFYENGQISSIEVVASSDNLSEFMNKSEYLRSLMDNISETVEKIESLKQQLFDDKNNVEKKKQEIVSLQQTQVGQRSDLDRERYSKQLLLSQATKQGATIQEMIADKEAEKKKVQDILNNPPPPPPVAPPPVITPPVVTPNPDNGTPPPNQGSIPMYFQNQGWWAWIPINDSQRPSNAEPSYMAEFGCKISSLAMIMKYYGQNVDPGTIAKDSRYFATGWQWDWLYWYGAQSASGLAMSKESSYSYSKADQWASWGKPFIASGDIFGVGYTHSVVITGRTADGRWIMNDPIQGEGRIFPLSPGQITDYIFVN